MSTNHHPELLASILAHCREHNMSRSAFGLAAIGDPRLVFDIEAGRELRRKTADRIHAYMNTQGASA